MYLDPPVLAALVSATVALIVGLLVAATAERKFRRDYALDFAAERVVRRLLKHKDWKWRSFSTVKHFVGGFEDDELRRILVRAGAIRSLSHNDIELWGLIERVDWPETADERHFHGSPTGFRAMKWRFLNWLAELWFEIRYRLTGRF